MSDGIRWETVWRIFKWRDPAGEIARIRKAGASLEELFEKHLDVYIGSEEVRGNVALNEGLQYLIEIITGIEATPTLWDDSNARVGVGNGVTAADPTDTDLKGASKAYAAMDATYPKRSGQKAQFSGTFAPGEAEFAWEEWVIDNGSVSGKTLNRKVESKGTKGAGESWTLTVEITFS